jgi:hypothetical protein
MLGADAKPELKLLKHIAKENVDPVKGEIKRIANFS